MAYIQTINLKESERIQLSSMVKRGRWSQHEIKRAQILLLADKEKGISNGNISKRLKCHKDTARVIKKRYIEEGLEAALADRFRSGQPKKLSDKEEALIIATACSKVPAGHDHWTIEMLTDFTNKRRKDDPVSQRPITRILLQNELKPWLKKNVGHSKCNS